MTAADMGAPARERHRASGHQALDTLARCRELVLPALRDAVARLHPEVGRIAAYSLGWCDADGTPQEDGAGKALRPALAVLAAETVGGKAQDAVPAAVAVELVHVFSLVHDDIIDGDERRRHRPTAWKAFGSGPALLAGDGLLALALDALAESTLHLLPRIRSEALHTLTGSLVELVNGQAADTAFERLPWTGREAVTVAQYNAMAAGKTGSLLGCSAALGALLGGADVDTADAMGRMGRNLGAAFQAVDDLLGIWGDPDVTGKPVFNDIRRRKKTLPVVAALAHGPAPDRLAALLAAPAEEGGEAGALDRIADLIREAGGRTFTVAQANRDLDRALRTLHGVSVDPAATAELMALAEFVVNRTH
ncbi:polyprenyl synthetase family protein [Streptomyces sp. NPDC004126]|uniref:polyprenyl synthetase family protein n=1 Tax=Streptomyces sp. NPDC004126 TaxID=3390695 RepID=UPI003D008FD6